MNNKDSLPANLAEQPAASGNYFLDKYDPCAPEKVQMPFTPGERLQ